MMCDLGGFATEGSEIGRCLGVAASPVRVREVWLERHLEEHPEFEGNLTHRRLARQLVADVRVMSVSAVARREGSVGTR